MKLISISTLLILWMSFAEAHPLHLSITNITYENGKLKISMKTFRDDWEMAYFHYHGTVIDLLDEESLQEPWLSSYLEDRFSLARAKGDIPTEISIDTILISEDTMVIEMQGELEGNPKSFYLYNALLTDIFPDQTNLVIFEYKEKETGIKFDVRKHEEEVELK
ncbi:MAG: hypothetical protein QNK35_08725 [Bacteroides sp.]|nr:hypothetical protein [Bacteroides sp.]